jgi:hypothetical protein
MNLYICIYVNTYLIKMYSNMLPSFFLFSSSSVSTRKKLQLFQQNTEIKKDQKELFEFRMD